MLFGHAKADAEMTQAPEGRLPDRSSKTSFAAIHPVHATFIDAVYRGRCAASPDFRSAPPPLDKQGWLT